MAVLFADITNSTGIYQHLGDLAARNAVGACLSALASVLPRHGGRLVKTIGDEVMCVFPTAQQAVLAASEMQSLVAQKKANGYSLAIHVGLHCGPVLVEDDDVFGDTVNVAAYLTATAMGEQILTTEAVERNLPAGMKNCVRPVFHAVLKGSTEESTVYQVLWRTDDLDLTDINLNSNKLIPSDSGSLVLKAGPDRSVSVDVRRTSLVLGRGRECDLVVTDKFASRRHLTIRLLRTHFYLIDHSSNGTYVLPEGGREVQILRGELVLEGSGRISLGRSCTDAGADVIDFTRDRRAIYRV